MAEINTSLLQNNRTLQSLHLALDPKSLILSQFSDSHKPRLNQLTTTESFVMIRGPRYKEYSDLRDERLRTKKRNLTQQETPEKETVEKILNRPVLTPQKKQVKFCSNVATPPKRPNNKTNPSIVAQSVPDFSSVLLRKENRKPVSTSPLNKSVTPPVMKSGTMYGKMVGGGSKSTISDEKRSGGFLRARKSYANIEELKGLAHAVRGEIVNGGKSNNANRGGVRKSAVFGFRHV